MTYAITNNAEFGSLEITFDSKPAETVREALKAIGYRWHSVKKCWYGYTDEATARAAIEGTEEPATVTAQEAAPAPQNHIRIYYNGIKIDGGKLIRCGYSIDNNHDHHESVTIYAREYGAELPRDLFDVRNDTDIYTDYFDKDSAEILPVHPLYKYFRYAAMKARARDDRPYTERIRATLNSGKREPWPGHYDALRADLERREAFIKAFDAMTDPGQPTAADLEAIDRRKQEAENARKAAELAEEQKRRERVQCARVNGARLIEAEQAAHPVTDGEPVVIIRWSEHPAFYGYGDNALKLSITAAEHILKALDEQTPKNEGYFKTSFEITGKDENGDPISYEGRYDLGDHDGGMIAHIRAWGEWNRTHNLNGSMKEEPAETDDIIIFADWLAEIVARHETTTEAA